MLKAKALYIQLVWMLLTTASVSAAPTLVVNEDSRDEGLLIDISKKDNDSSDGHLFLKNGLFEGDLMLSKEFIRKFYNLSSILEEKPKSTNGTDFDSKNNVGNTPRIQRAAVRNNMLLWRGGRVPYLFSRSIPQTTRALIRRAMDHWETHTCLRFTPRYWEGDYVQFDNTQNGCFSNSIGQKGGKQMINLERNNPQQNTGCEFFGKIVHEIGHAVGFWHEQSRPDRDSYITLNVANIQKNELSQFMKRTYRDVDSRGSTYDYGSIMHYSDVAFVRDYCDGCKTLQVTNEAAYTKQGRPTMGQENGLSLYDIMQANTLYTCPRSFYGVLSGTLTIHARYGKNLPDKDGLWNLSDPYLEIIATDRDGNSVTKTTSSIGGNLNPVWNEWVVFENRTWTQFSVGVYDSDPLNADDPLSNWFTWRLVSHGRFADRKFDCYSGYAIFDYSF